MKSWDYLFDRLWQRKIPFFTVFFGVVLVTYTFLFIIDFIPEPITEEAEPQPATAVAPEPVVAAAVAEVTELPAAAAEVVPAEVVVEPAAPAAPTPDTAEPVVEASTDTPGATELSTEAEPVPGVEERAFAPSNSLPRTIIFDTLDKSVAVLNPTSRSIPDLDAALLNGVVRHPDSADYREPGNVFILGHSSYLPNVLNKNFQAFNGIQKLAWGDTIRVQTDEREYTYFVTNVYQAKASEVVVPNTPGKANLTLATCNSFGSMDDRFIVEAKLVEDRLL